MTYMLNKEKWTIEKTNLGAQKAIFKAKKAALERPMAEMIREEVARLVDLKLKQITDDIRHLQEVTIERE